MSSIGAQKSGRPRRVADLHVPVRISGKRNSAALPNESDWRAIEETLSLCSIPGMRESIVEGMATPLEECVKEIEW